MEKIRWAAKIRQAKIWQLYQNDAQGMVDEALLNMVGFDLLQRCSSIWKVTRREVDCPRCGQTFALAEDRPWKLRAGLQTCPTDGCGWEITAEEWHASWQHRDLLGAAAMQAVETYLNDYPKAHSSQERMICIDQLIHSFHIDLQTGRLNRSFANNLIEGSHGQVIDLLDRLFALPGGTDKNVWQQQAADMKRRRHGQE